MSSKDKELYEFGQFRLDVAEHFLTRLSGGERVSLSEKAFETLCVLVRNGGNLVRKDELMNQVWADSFVEENNLDKCIYAIRKALGEKPGEQKYIETVRKHGYRFVAEVHRIEAEAEPIYNETAIYSKLKQTPTQNFPRHVEHPEMQNQGAVIALADWRHETDKNRPKESNGQPAKLELVPTKQVIRSQLKYRAFLAAALLVGASVACEIRRNGNIIRQPELNRAETIVGTIEPIPNAFSIDRNIGFTVTIKISRRDFIG